MRWTRRVARVALGVTVAAGALLSLDGAPSRAGTAVASRRVPATAPISKPRPPRLLTDHWDIPADNINPLVRRVHFHSEILKRDVGYLVYLPPGYDADATKRYPVIYWLVGVSGDCRNSGKIPDRYDAAIRSGACPPAILVIPQGVFGSFYTDSKDGGRPIESVYVKELIPHVDATYRTIATRDGRGVEGHSMGGYGAAHLGFTYPDLFGAVSIYSAPLAPIEFFRKECAGVATDVWGDDPDYFAARDPWNLVERNLKSIAGKTKVRVQCGSQDRFVVSCEEFHQRLTSLGIAHDYAAVDGAGHTLGEVLDRLGDTEFRFWREAFGRSATASVGE
jgi:endo-1,4-beta-xylanase